MRTPDDPGAASFVAARIACALGALRTVRVKRLVSRFDVDLEGEGTPDELDEKVPAPEGSGPPAPEGIEVRGVGFSLGSDGSLKRALAVVKSSRSVLGFKVRVMESLGVRGIPDDAVPRFDLRGVLAEADSGYVVVGYGKDVPLARPFRRPLTFGGTVGERPFKALFEALTEADGLR